MNSVKTMWNESFTDRKTLTENVQGIVKDEKYYNIQIVIGKYKDEVNACMEELLKLPNHDDSKDIDCSIDEHGKLNSINAKWVRGSHPALHYRGNALKRHKVWFQQSDAGYYLYKYTGWQKKVSNATFKIDDKRFPNTSALVEKMKRDCPQNQWISTIYEDGNDYIGMHSDKTKTWKKGSNFQVIKWGHPRIFKITINDHKEVDKCTVLFEKILPAGTSVLVDMKTNEITRHGVPPMENVGKSGSIVGRDIDSFVTNKKRKRMVEQAEKDRLKRIAKKNIKKHKV